MTPLYIERPKWLFTLLIFYFRTLIIITVMELMTNTDLPIYLGMKEVKEIKSNHKL